ncbi:hypothetical protein ABT010_13135 [Streptomyces sp. NPDC002668]|uniref:hypothetical protein n=1 Tax=Streptomyces sp. NPDC002668 TaxID=3154422 RepID=UPI0033318DDB
MSARIELTAMFAPFLSGTTLEEAVSEAYALVMNEAADEADSHAQFHGGGAAGRALRYLAKALRTPAAVPVPDETAGDKTGEEYPGELAHLRDLLRDVGRLADKQPEGNPVTELLIDHYSDSRMVDAQLAKTTTPCHTNADGHRMVNGHCLYCGKSAAEVTS